MARRFLSNVRINDAYTLPASDGTNNQVIKTDGSGNLTFGQLATDSASVIYKDTFTGDGSTTTFTMANALNDENQSNIYIDGVYQSKSTYSVANKVITFSTAPASGHAIEVISTTGINSGPTAIFTDNFTANGSATAFTLGQTVHDENQTLVFLNGVYQFKNTYTLSGTTLTLDTAPANGVAIEVMSIGSAYSGGDILYDHDFTSAGLMKTNGSGTYSIVADNSSNWNTAYTYSQVGHLPLAGGTLTGNLIVGGDLTVNGTTTTLNTQTVEVEDNILQLNTTQGTPDTATATTSGISIYRGNGVTQASFIFDDGDDTWDLTNNLAIEGNIILNDNAKAIFGAGSDLKIFSDGSGGYIRGVTAIQSQDGSDDFLLTAANAGVSLFYNNVKKFETLSDGAKIHGEFYIDEKITHTGDGNTYLQFQTDRQTYVAGGVEFIDFAETTQNYITIGGSSDIDTRMQGGSGYIFIQGSNGYIGINDASPSYPFEVNGNTNIGGELHVRNVIYGYAGVGNQIGGVSWTSTDSGFLFAKTGNVTKILLNSNGDSYLNGGNVGIGTTTPQKALHIEGASGASASQLLVCGPSDTTGDTAGILLRAEGGEGDSALRAKGGIFFERNSTGNGLGSLHFCNNNSNNNDSADLTDSHMTILGNGNVGIGTTNPLFGLSMAQGTGDGNRIGWNDGGGAKRASIICSSSTDALQFHTGTSDAERMRIDSGGDVLMGNTVVNPASGFASQRGFGYDNSTGNVQIAATSGNALTVGRNESSDGAIMTLRKESNVKHSFGSTTSYLLGNVGIGTTSPGYKLHVSGTGGTRMSITNTDTNWAALQIQAKDNQADYIFFKDDTEERARIIAFDSSDLVFSNTDSATERMRITSAGNIGIGTTSPSKKLDIRTDNGVLIKGASGSTNANLSFLPASGGREYAFSNDSSSFYIKDISADVTRMYFHYNGNTGIGTTNPQNKFVVANGTDNTQNIEIAPNYIQSFNRQSGNLGYASMGFYASSYAFNSGNVSVSNFLGVGLTQPAYKFQIYEATDRSLSSSQAQMKIDGNGYSAFFALDGDSFQIGQNSNYRDLTFHSGASSADILERMRIKSHGDVVIGGTSTQNARTASFDVGTNNIVFDNCTTSGAGNGAEFQTFRRNNGSNSVQIGSIVMNGTSGVTYATSSDYRLKENVVELTNALDRVDQLKPSRFNFISDEGRTIDGFLAHEVQDIVPEAVVGIKDGVDEDGNPKYQSIDQSKLVPLLVGAIKELKAEIEQLKTQING